MKNIYFFLLFIISPLWAQPIQSVDIQGLKNISEPFIRHLLISKPHTSFDPELWNQDLKRVYSFGFFQQIVFSQEIVSDEIKLYIQLIEHPILLEMEIQGNHHLASTLLLSHLLLKKGTFLAPYEVNEAVQTLIRLYQEHGFWFVQVRSRQEPQENGVSLYFEIEEGSQVRIEKIILEGIQTFQTEDLLPYLLTPPRGNVWKTEVLSSLKLQTDRLALVHFYRAQGFLEVQVDSAQLKQESLNASESEQIVVPVFHIREGPRYQIDHVSFYGNTYVAEPILREKISLAAGQFLTQKELTHALRTLYELYQKSPYKQFQVTPEVLFREDPSDTRAQLLFYFTEE